MTLKSCPIRSKHRGTDCARTQANADYDGSAQRGPPRFVVFGFGVALGLLTARRFRPKPEKR
ncbi:hypothetical protein [Haladaptatus caseinilyticus]|uniref:hypothetical protein n=1 Tax=Haladaptatus caseinilyticus TaxID=2993314 RepID=UPI00224B1A32|nr:hypothetical protein [Haladaptatus caseinilyticus]